MPCAWLFKRLVTLVPATALLSATRFCACAPEPFLGGWPLLPTAGPGPGPLVSTSAPWSVALLFCVAVRNLVSYFTFMRAVGAEPFLVSALRRFCVLYIFMFFGLVSLGCAPGRVVSVGHYPRGSAKLGQSQHTIPCIVAQHVVTMLHLYPLWLKWDQKTHACTLIFAW